MKAEKLIILCGPSGSGKTTVARHMLGAMPGLAFSISATTRNMRPSEQDGKDYHFLTPDDFRSRLAKNEFVEWEEVYPGTYYGTLKTELERIWSEGKIPVLDIDVIGAKNIKKNFAPQALALFVHPMNIENIKARLGKRATESAESFAIRVNRAMEELNHAPEFDAIIYNDDLEHALEQAEKLIEDYLHKDQKIKA
jgi:guanylate kinase